MKLLRASVDKNSLRKVQYGFFLKMFLQEFLMEHNYLKVSERRPPKEHSCEIW